jgi:signal transduction histidine kinase
MLTDPNYSEFASPARSSAEDLETDRRLVAEAPGLTQTLDLMPVPALILNKNRQIVHANRAFRKLTANESMQELLGRRPGEVLDCTYAQRNAAGCGTTRFCKECGALKAIRASQKGQPDLQECQILQKGDTALEFKVWSNPFKIQGHRFSLFTVADQSSEKRRRALERLFYHDVLNTAGGLYGYADLLAELVPEDGETGRYARSIFNLSETIIDEIHAQKELSAAESKELVPKFVPVEARALLEEVASGYRAHQISKGKTIQVANDSPELTLTTDRTLLKRVLSNMTKNALEASAPGEVVTLSCEDRDGSVAFTVHNPKAMPESVQLQIFKRSFSTKGVGRGLGTYSIKLFTERYLGGRVWFTSSPEEGTTFTACLPLEPPSSKKSRKPHLTAKPQGEIS